MTEIRRDVLEAAVAFKEQMRRFGRGFKFAKADDITETYHYRWFSSFLSNCYKRGLNLKASKEVIKAIVGYAKDNGLLNKGASLLARKDIFDIAYDRIKEELEDTENSWEVLKDRATRLLEINDLERFLKRKPNRHGQINLLEMRDSGQLPDSLICLSKSCMRAYIKIDGNDGMPSLLDYAKLRIRVIEKFGNDELRQLLGDEYNG